VDTADAHMPEDRPATMDAGDGGDAGDGAVHCVGGEPCHTNGDCCGFQWCFINAVVASCASAPVGVCTPPSGSNCLTHPNICDCLGSPSCTAPGTQCHALGNTHAAPDDCFSCVQP
jgi:hypothetical protein